MFLHCSFLTIYHIRPQNRPALTAGALYAAGGHREGAADAMLTVAQSSLIQVNFYKELFSALRLCSQPTQPVPMAPSIKAPGAGITPSPRILSVLEK